MKRIPNLNLSQTEYLTLISQRITRGGEGIIYPGSRPNTLFKIFIDIYDNKNPMSENKERKVTELFQMNLDGLIKPIRTISYNGIIIGYEISYDKNDIALRDLTLPRQELIKVLKSSRDILLQLKEKDITYGDVTEDNILYNPKSKKVKFCDIDNIRLGIYPVDSRGFSLNKYYTETGTIDAKADAYMHNLLTIRLLSYPSNAYDNEVLVDLRRGNYPSKFKLPAKDIFRSMTDTKTFNGEYVVQYVKR